MRVERRDAVAVWTLARPHARNALDRATFDALEAALAEAAAAPGLRAVVLTGEGDTFASGGDLRELRTAKGREAAGRLSDAGRRVCDRIRALPVPVLAALPGPAIGGGSELAIACDLRVADPGATLSFKHVRMGVTTAWGVVGKLVATVGHGAAGRLLLTGSTVDAQDALAMGLVTSVSAPGQCVVEAEALAHEIAQGAPGAVAGMKALLGGALDDTRLRGLERVWFEQTWASADHEEAVEAFFEGRRPRWSTA